MQPSSMSERARREEEALCSLLRRPLSLSLPLCVPAFVPSPSSMRVVLLGANSIGPHYWPQNRPKMPFEKDTS